MAANVHQNLQQDTKLSAGQYAVQCYFMKEVDTDAAGLSLP